MRDEDRDEPVHTDHEADGAEPEAAAQVLPAREVMAIIDPAAGARPSKRDPDDPSS